MPGAFSVCPPRARSSGSTAMWRSKVPHRRCRGEPAQHFVIHRMKRPGSHRRDPRWTVGKRQRIEPHEEPRGSESGERVLRHQTSDDCSLPASAVIERDDASRFRGLGRTELRRAGIRSVALRAAKRRGPANIADSAHGGSCCSLGTSCNYKITVCKTWASHARSRSGHG